MCWPGRRSSSSLVAAVVFKFVHSISGIFACLLHWQELEDDKPLTPTNFKEFMADQAQQTRALNEAVAQFKALLQTRKEL